MLALQEALKLGKIGDKVLLLDRGGAIFSPCSSDGWLREGFELTITFVSQIVKIYDHQKKVIYETAGVHHFITALEEKLNDQPLFDRSVLSGLWL